MKAVVKKKIKKPSVAAPMQLNDWKKEYVGMPEYNAKELRSVKSVLVHFKTYKDMDDFSKLMGQLVTKKTKFIWYPKDEKVKIADKRYVSES